MFDSGALRLVVLGLIAAQPRHGYDIIRLLKARFQGSYSPSPGSIYPIL
jgi:DNA-binding PadR family transcriptional regulator